MLKAIFTNMYVQAEEQNRQNILGCIARGAVPDGTLVDLGCHDGTWTNRIGEMARARSLWGVEVVPEPAEIAARKGVNVKMFDLNHSWDLPSGRFDVVHSNQVIEHVADVDLFAAETYRVLKPGGLAVVSTENGSSWHNVFAAALGWQIFSLTNVSGKIAGLGNPLAIHRHGKAFSETWKHRTIFNYLGLKELFEVHGFVDVRVVGAGYYPLPAVVGVWDSRHGAFITLSARKA